MREQIPGERVEEAFFESPVQELGASCHARVLGDQLVIDCVRDPDLLAPPLHPREHLMHLVARDLSHFRRGQRRKLDHLVERVQQIGTHVPFQLHAPLLLDRARRAPETDLARRQILARQMHRHEDDRVTEVDHPEHVFDPAAIENLQEKPLERRVGPLQAAQEHHRSGVFADRRGEQPL